MATMIYRDDGACFVSVADLSKDSFTKWEDERLMQGESGVRGWRRPSFSKELHRKHGVLVSVGAKGSKRTGRKPVFRFTHAVPLARDYARYKFDPWFRDPEAQYRGTNLKNSLRKLYEEFGEEVRQAWERLGHTWNYDVCSSDRNRADFMIVVAMFRGYDSEPACQMEWWNEDFDREAAIIDVTLPF